VTLAENLRLRTVKHVALAATLALAGVLSGCGYHVAGQSNRLPQNVHVLAVPIFINQTQTYRIEQILTQDVVREFIGRTRYRVVTTTADSDAILNGTVLSALASPLTYDAQSGRISSAVVTVTMKVKLTDKAGRVLFENPNYSFREQYQVSREVASFFEEETPALQRMSQDFARTLVSDILEAF
jgi:outer membrane lipopolysaccharide assembly protein LptE/RlpB